MPFRDHQLSAPAREMAEEHGRLYDMVGYLKFAIVDAVDEETSTQAVNILFDRMALHFAVEEKTAAEVNEEWGDILRADHKKLLDSISCVRDIQWNERGERERVLMRFVEALTRHDAEVDAPILHAACRRHR